MDSIRKWFNKPKKDDKSLLARFFYADEDLNMVASELDSFDGRKDPERCTTLVNQLRQCQDKVLTITNTIMDDLIGDERADRDFRVKFPEDVLQENLAGQLWFGAECLAAGSSIMNREAESIEMRPLAKALTKSLENVRNLLREACLRNNTPNRPLKLNSNDLITEMLIESLKIFDRLFAEFELRYVSAMVPVKSTQEYELQELIGVLFSETLQRALEMHLLTQDMVDDCDPALMFTIPRLAIVSGLLVFPKGPLCIDRPIEEMSEMFRPFRTLLHKIRELLWTLNKKELYMLEKLLCDNEQFSDLKTVSDLNVNNDLDDFVNRFYNDYPSCKDFVSNFYTVSVNHNQNDYEIVDEAKEIKHTTKELPINEGRQNNTSNNIEIPSTSSGYLISNTVGHDTIIASLAEIPHHQPSHVESLPDSDSLEAISEAAATLSTILTVKDDTRPHTIENVKKNNLESPSDSGICTENTSLDRSPTIDLIDNKNCNCRQKSSIIPLCKCYKESGNTNGDLSTSSTNQDNFLPSASKIVRKRMKMIKEREKIPDEDSSSLDSTDTSSFDSNCVDDEEIALALQAAEIACRNEVRAKFRSSEDLIHRLYVCIAGVADQLQTNFASDLRNILKSVFLMNASSNDTSVNSNSSVEVESSIEYHPTENQIIENNEFTVDPNILAQEALFDSNVYFHLSEEENASGGTSYSNHPRPNEVNNDLHYDTAVGVHHNQNTSNNLQQPPIWIPDEQAPKCMSCDANFTVVKRRHHCRNCGRVFCARCSANGIPLPKYGYFKPVRVCNKCFLYNLAPFTM